MRAASPAYAVEISTAAEMADEVEAWHGLARRAVEPNIFAEPELVLPAIQHLPEGRNAALLLVWEGPKSTAGGGVLRGVFPCVTPRLAVARQMRIWTPTEEAPGIPLVDRMAPADTIEAALAFLGARFARFTGLVIPQVPTDGGFAAALRSASLHGRRTLEPFEIHQRRVLVPRGDDALEGVRRVIVDDLRAGRQRMAALGEVEMDHARSARWVRDAVEELLVLDASGAAAARGEALVQEAGMASFVRIATRQLAHHARCRVDVLRIDGKAIAAAIVLESDRVAWLWKVAADPAFAHLAADAHLLLDVTRTQLDRPGLSRTEACCGRDSAVLGDLWQERTAADYLVTLRPRPSPATLATRIGEGLRRLRAGPRVPARAKVP